MPLRKLVSETQNRDVANTLALSSRNRYERQSRNQRAETKLKSAVAAPTPMPAFSAGLRPCSVLLELETPGVIVAVGAGISVVATEEGPALEDGGGEAADVED